MRFDEIKKLVSEEYGRKIRSPYDLEPEEEVLISRYAKEKWDADFVFVTHYPSRKRPFYAMDDPADPTYTLSFDLLFRGMEITTGGQRIHDYESLVAKMEQRGIDRRRNGAVPEHIQIRYAAARRTGNRTGASDYETDRRR